MYVSYLECPKCGATQNSEQQVQLCACGSPLLVRYHLEQVKKTLHKEDLNNRKPDLWRYRELLPVKKDENIISLGEGMTPMLHLGKIVGTAVKKYGWFDASTLKEPYRIEGKKTMGLEIAEQFNWELPDVILYPTGGGVGIIGIYKALNELKEIGWVSSPLPRLVSVQASGCAPIVRAWELGASDSEFWQDAQTCAFGITVPKALGDFLVLEAVRNTNGCAVAVTDQEILQAEGDLAAQEGTFVCPEGAANLAALRQLKDCGWVKANEKVVLLNTGAGIKYPETISIDVPLLRPDDEL